MGRFHGEVGYGLSVEDPPASGVWVDQIIERTYTGDVLLNNRRLSGEKVLDDVVVSNQISVVADQFAYEHFFGIRYLRWAGVLWKVTYVDVRRPRLIMNLGEVYNGPTP